VFQRCFEQRLIPENSISDVCCFGLILQCPTSFKIGLHQSNSTGWWNARRYCRLL